jgi:hypothetical protein
VKPLIPESVRFQGRRRLTRKDEIAETLHPLKRRNGMNNALHDIEVVKRSSRALECESKSTDPHIVFVARPFYSGEVKGVRFRLKHDLAGETHAQLFWTHAVEEGFCETKSVRVPLQKGKWAEYELRMDAPELKAAWQSGPEIIHMRFDPVDAPGTFAMGPVELLF